MLAGCPGGRRSPPRLWVPGDLVSTHLLCNSQPRSLPGRWQHQQLLCPFLTSRHVGLVQSAGACALPGQPGPGAGGPQPLTCCPHSRFPAATSAKEGALVVEAVSHGTAWSRDLPRDPPVCFQKTGRVGDLPPLLPLRGPHPTLCQPEPLSGLLHPWAWVTSDTTHCKP